MLSVQCLGSQQGRGEDRNDDDGIRQVYRSGRGASRRFGHRGRVGGNAMGGVCEAVRLGLAVEFITGGIV